MPWYVLKNRRHVGPYQDFELVAMHRRLMLGAEDFVISEDNMQKGELIYERVSDAVRLDEVPDDPRKPAVAKPKIAEDSEPLLGSFTDDELEKSQVSRVFTEAVEAMDLVSHAPTSAATARKEVARVSEARAAHAPEPVSITNSDLDDSLWERYRTPAVAALVLVSVGVGAFSFRTKLGIGKFFDTAATKFQHKSTVTYTNGNTTGNTNPSRPSPSRMPASRPITTRPNSHSLHVPEVRHDDPGPAPNHFEPPSYASPSPVEPERPADRDREPAGGREDEHGNPVQGPPRNPALPHAPAVPGQEPLNEEGAPPPGGGAVPAAAAAPNGEGEEENRVVKPAAAPKPAGAGDNGGSEDYERRD